MAGLKLKLRPEEQLLINGAVIQNGAKQTELTIKTPNTRILRLRDALHPDNVTTPVTRICYCAQLAVAGEVSEEAAQKELISSIKALQKIFTDSGSQEKIARALENAEQKDFYRTMQLMRKFIPYEEALMAKMQIATHVIDAHQTHDEISDAPMHLNKMAEAMQQGKRLS